jgi:glutathione synthase/RimK-type ligase-like ATP-grasp enzyme
VVTKPDYGACGADVRIRRAGRVRWGPSDPPVRFASRGAIIVQQFIYTGAWPVSYRVNTLFGKVLYSQRAEASHERRPFAGPESFTTSSVTATHPGCSFTLNNDREIIALAERAHAAFPEIAVLGVDILCEEPSGRLFVIEVNSSGEVWHFSSRTGKAIQAYAGFDYSSQFGGLRRVAEILIEETRQQAR